MKLSILGTKIDALTKQETLARIEDFLQEKKFHQIATVNPEFILEAQKDPAFHFVLTNCDLNVPDGKGILIAIWILWFKSLLSQKSTTYGLRFAKIYPGIDLMWDILAIAHKKNLKVFFVANNRGLSTWEETAQAIKKIYPSINISGTNLDPGKKNITNYEFFVATYHIVFCNFGAPEQEIFLRSVKNAKIASVRLVMGVGGSFDYITGKVPRAPQWMRICGLEWFFRLLIQPKRWKRILNAVIIFPLKVLRK